MAEIKNFVLSDDDEIPVPFAGVYSYWLDKRGEAWAPSMSNFHLDDLEAKILPWSVIVDIQPNPFELTYRFWGTKRTALIDKDMTGKKVSDIPSSYMREGNFKEYHEVYELKKPLLCNTPVANKIGIEVMFQSIRLPLSNERGDYSHIFSAMNYEQFSASHFDYFGTNPKPYNTY
jgi:hypothetical protein